MKRLIRLLLLTGALLAGLSCDRLPEGPAIDKDSAPFVGIWAVSSDNPAFSFSYWVLYDDGTAKKIDASDVYANRQDWRIGGIGEWSYDRDTKILATTVKLFQVQVTMAGEKEWTAIGTDGKYHYTGKLFNGSELDRLYFILMGTRWVGSQYGSFSIGAPLFAYFNKYGSTSATALWCSMPYGIQETEPVQWPHLWITQFDDAKNDIEYHLLTRKYGVGISREYYFEGNGTEVTRFEITDPLSPSSCRLVMNVTVKEESSGTGTGSGSGTGSGTKTRKYEDTYRLEFSE